MVDGAGWWEYLGDLFVELLTDFAPHQAAGGGKDDELRQCSVDVRRALVTPLAEIRLGLLEHHWDVVGEGRGVEGGRHELDLLSAALWFRAVDYALAEERDAELVGILLTQILVARLAELLLSFWPAYEGKALPKHIYSENIAIDRMPSLSHRQWIP